MLQSEPDRRPGPPGGAAANGIHDHQHRATVRPQQAVHILRSSGLFYTVSGQILAHCGDEWFRVGHHPIVAPVQEPSLKQSECLTIGEFWLEETAS